MNKDFSQKSQQDEVRNSSVGSLQDPARHKIPPLMNFSFAQAFEQGDIPMNISQPKTSKLLLNEEGLKLLQETTEAVRLAINKVNVFKHFLNRHTRTSIFNNVEILPSGNNTNQLNAHSLGSSVLTNQNDSNLQVFFTIPEKQITESEVREVLEKEGFEDFVITIKNRPSHSFGFVKFSKEEAVTRSLEYSMKLSVNGHLMKIRPHKPNYTTPASNNEESNSVSQEIDESLLINISSGYQNKRTLIDNYEPAGRKDDEEMNDLPDNTQPDKSYYHSSKPQLLDSQKLILSDSVMNNINDNSVQTTDTNLIMNLSQNEMDYDPNEYLENTFPTTPTQSSKKKSPFFRGRGRGRRFHPRGYSRGWKKSNSPRYFENHNDRKADKK